MNNRTHIIKVRMSDQELETLSGAASDEGLGLSPFIRSAALEKVHQKIDYRGLIGSGISIWKKEKNDAG